MHNIVMPATRLVVQNMHLTGKRARVTIQHVVMLFQQVQLVEV